VRGRRKSPRKGASKSQKSRTPAAEKLGWEGGESEFPGTNFREQKKRKKGDEMVMEGEASSSRKQKGRGRFLKGDEDRKSVIYWGGVCAPLFRGGRKGDPNTLGCH